MKWNNGENTNALKNLFNVCESEWDSRLSEMENETRKATELPDVNCNLLFRAGNGNMKILKWKKRRNENIHSNM